MVVALTPFKQRRRSTSPTCCCRSRRSPRPRAPSSTPKGRVQSFHGVVKPLGEARPAWKVLRVLGNLLGLQGFDVRDAPKTCAPKRSAIWRRLPARLDNRVDGSDGAPAPAPPPPARSSASPTCRSTRPTRWCAAPRRCSSPPTRAPPVAGLPSALWPSLGLAAGAQVRVTQGDASGRAAGALDPTLAAERRARAGRPSGAPRRSARCSAPIDASRKRVDASRRLTRRRARLDHQLRRVDARRRLAGRLDADARSSPLRAAAAAAASPTSRCGSARRSAGRQIRPGPNRVGPLGLLQPIADAVKLIFKEIIVPTAANKGLFFLGPVMTIMPALAAWAVVPFGPDVALAEHQRRPAVPDGDHLDGGLRRDHRRLGVELEVRVPRRAARVGADGELRDRDGLRARRRADGLGEPEHDRHRARARASGWFADARRSPSCRWNWLPLLPIFVVYFISGIAETNRASVRRGRGRVGDRRRPHGRVLGHGVRDVLPRRVRQHDPGLGARRR